MIANGKGNKPNRSQSHESASVFYNGSNSVYFVLRRAIAPKR